MLLKKKNMDQFNLKKYQCRRITTSTSTWEKREENIKALEEEKRLLFMDEKRHGTTRFHPTFSRLDFIHDWRQRKLDASKIPSQYFLDRRIQITDGRILIRTIKFRRNVNEKIFYSILNVFSRPPLHNDYEAELRWGTIPDTSYEGEKMRFYLGPEIVAAHLLNSFLRLYVIENTLCFDAPARTEPIAEPPQSPAPVPSPLDVPPLQTHAPPATSPVPSILPLPTAPTSSSSLSPALPPPNPTLPFNVQTPKMTAKEITPPLVPPDKIKPPPKARKLKKASTTHTLPSSSGMKKALELEKEKFHELEPEPKPEPETEPKTELELEPTKPAVLEKKKTSQKNHAR
ncbi:hypothetical protein HMI55_006876 [Coelomomyces lativittatus]|nr:hypothetical protein HMI55_006876 [Coelomomyces lativittatus]